jgi:sulfatase modifying factor 1
MSARGLVRLVGLPLLLVSACQALGGFEDFESKTARGKAGSAGNDGSAGAPGAAGNSRSGSSAGDASAGTPPTACDDGQSPGLHGSQMVSWTRPNGTCFWIDETEVTVGDYRQFLGSSDGIVQEGACAWNTPEPGSGGSGPDANGNLSGFEPSSSCVADITEISDPAWPDPNVPVSCIDWCDAQAYCQWAGKDLCADGVTAQASDDPLKSDWFATCANDGNAYPYGNQRSANACNGSDSSDGCGTKGSSCVAVPVESYTSCVAVQGQSQVYDLSGNVAEWTRGCETSSAISNCNTRGGSFNSTGSTLNCATVAAIPRGTCDRKVGFRCCAEAVSATAK